MNKCIFCGRIGQEIEMKTTNDGTEYCNFTIAVNRRVGKGKEPITDWIPVKAWGKTASFINTYFHKGDGITVEGRMESRKWQDNDGNNRTSWAITVDNVEFPIGGKSRSNNQTDEAQSSNLENFVENLPEDAKEITEIIDENDLPF